MSTILTALTMLEYPGALLGLIGAALVASSQASRRRAGFACWIASNLCLVTVFARSGMWALLAMQSVYLITSGMGWWNNREKPANGPTCSVCGRNMVSNDIYHACENCRIKISRDKSWMIRGEQ